MKYALGAALLLVGCASNYQAGIYDRQPWATVSRQQAEAECINFVNSAQGRGSNVYLCMQSKGWVERLP